ncbi:hypothetical protein [Pendulispora albinea]|uniref:Protein activator of alkane oxidation PraB n=1 Tax=Pendulispora albinea TaxID=2741071 RepID=A0ABZ2M7J4_9BACT
MYTTTAFIATTALALSAFSSDSNLSFRLDPPSTNFTATGAMKLTKGLVTADCTATFTGSTDANGNGSVSEATFSGGLLCGNLTATGFPWAVTPTSLTNGTFDNVTVNTSLGPCGPSNVPATYDNANGTITFTNATLSGGCTVSGTLTTTPKVTVVER